MLGAGESATGFVRAKGRGTGLKEPGTSSQGQRGPRCGAGDKEVQAGATPQGPLATLGPDRSGIVLSPGQTRGRETLPCSLWKIKKQETKVGRGK